MLALDSSYEKREAWAAATAERVAPLKDDPNLVGWFLDNELKRGKDWRSGNPNHLILGARASSLSMPPEVPSAAGPPVTVTNLQALHHVP